MYRDHWLWNRDDILLFGAPGKFGWCITCYARLGRYVHA
jgi:hypothetical protein